MADNSLRITRTIIRNAVRHVLREQIMNSMFPQETSVVDSFEESEVVQPEGESESIDFMITVIRRTPDMQFELTNNAELISAMVGQQYTDEKYPGCIVTINSIDQSDYQSDAIMYGDQVTGYDADEWHSAHGTLTMTSECFQDLALNGWGNEDPDAVRLQAISLNPDILPVMRETVEEIMFPHTALNDPDTTVEVVFTGEYVPQDSVI
jgi:hypothetical protein